MAWPCLTLKVRSSSLCYTEESHNAQRSLKTRNLSRERKDNGYHVQT